MMASVLFCWEYWLRAWADFVESVRLTVEPKRPPARITKEEWTEFCKDYGKSAAELLDTERKGR